MITRIFIRRRNFTVLKKLQVLFQNTVMTENPATYSGNEYLWLKENRADPMWLGIPNTEVSGEQLRLLSTLFESYLPDQNQNYGSGSLWYSYLFHQASLPLTGSANPIRFIQIQFDETKQNHIEMKDAVREYFHDCSAFLWLNDYSALIIEEKSKIVFTEEDFHSISITLENDFYMKSSLFIGKFRTPSLELRESFFHEQQLFHEARSILKKERIFTFEKSLPIIVAKNLPETTRTLLRNDVVKILMEDRELLRTLEVFLEQNSNASVTAKKLYIHRNTLQYRLDKFTEKTGIPLKGIENAITIYLACKMAATQD